MQSFSTMFVAACWRRVAIERMNTRLERSEFMRMRSPSSAPPERRRVGSTASTAMRISGNACEEALQQFVDDARLAGAAGAGDADHRASCRRPAAIACAGARARIRRARLPRSPTACADRDLVVERRRCVRRLDSAARAALARARTTSSIIATRPRCMPSLGW